MDVELATTEIHRVSGGKHLGFGPDDVIDALPPEHWNPETRVYEE